MKGGIAPSDRCAEPDDVSGRTKIPAARGHFARFVRPGARRIVGSPSRSALLSTAFVNPDGKVAVVVMNPTDEPVSYFLWVAGDAAQVESLPHSIQSLVF